jgi:cell division septum initiation protein DivIVA
MTIRGAESVPETYWAAPSGGPIAEFSDKPIVPPIAEDATPEGEVNWVNTELHEIASTIEALQSRLAQANSRLSSVEELEAKEIEIGRLFVDAQRFIEDYVSKVELKIHEVLTEAQAKATQILVEATQEARDIRGEAQQAAFESTSTVRELQSAIAGFTTVNAELLKELGSLNSMLSPGSNRTTAETDPPLPTVTHSTEPPDHL